MKQLLIFLFALHVLNISSHGFDEDTLVKADTHGFWQLSQICQLIYDKDQNVLSYDTNSNACIKSKVTSAGRANANCYIKFGFDKDCKDKIICTPTQEFYNPLTEKWVPAFHLKIGDQLLSKGNELKSVTHIQLIKKPLDVYSVEVKNTHNYFVGKHSILTHNMILPALSFGFSAAFGSGATIGGTAGSYFGPVTFAAGCVLGGLIGIAVDIFSDKKIPKYHLNFDVAGIDKCLQKKNDDTLTSKERIEVSIFLESKAPGIPTENDGFIPPKNWDGKKRKHPITGQHGYPDKKGNIWIPTGEKGHGGPHWDVQGTGKNGGYENILPGGKKR